MTVDKKNPGAIEYFDRKIENFDSIYSERKGLRGFLNSVLRTSVKARFELTFEELSDIQNRKILDVGCGSGRYMIEALKRGAALAVGIDAASGALEFAKKQAEDLKLSDKTRFLQTDFMDFQTEDKFDIVLAIGYFDYIFEPENHLKKMNDLCDRTIIASFPKIRSFWTPVRKIRLALNGCPVRFYTRRNIERIAGDAGLKNFELKSVYRDYILIAKK